MYSPVVFPASAADRMDVYLFCLLACDRDSCCDGFILTQVRGGNVVYNPGSAKDGSQKPGCTAWKLLWGLQA